MKIYFHLLALQEAAHLFHLLVFVALRIVVSVVSLLPNEETKAVHGAMDCGQKKFQLVLRCHQLLSGFLAPSVASVTAVANDKGDNEMIRGAVYRSPGICLTAEENTRKPELGDRLMKGPCVQSSPQMGSLSSK